MFLYHFKQYQLNPYYKKSEISHLHHPYSCSVLSNQLLVFFSSTNFYILFHKPYHLITYFSLLFHINFCVRCTLTSTLLRLSTSLSFLFPNYWLIIKVKTISEVYMMYYYFSGKNYIRETSFCMSPMSQP